MKFPFFTGKRQAPLVDAHKELPSRRFEPIDPQYYDTDKELVDAINVALLMNQPLLLTGEPGTGKTQLAYRIAWELNFGEPLKFETKSNSVSKELFYFYNALARFQDIHTEDRQEAVEYITYNALGKAILNANEKDKVKHLLPKSFRNEHNGPARSVVLIDEIDKAPRDFPNDILNEIENMYFRVPEIGNVKIEAPPDMNPVVIITSNSESYLPDPFLRRCVFYNIEFPNEDRMKQIVEKRITNIKNDDFISDAIKFFFQLRDYANPPLRKKPSTSELLDWMNTLKMISKFDNPMKDSENLLVALSTLVKTEIDLKNAQIAVREWIKAQE